MDKRGELFKLWEKNYSEALMKYKANQIGKKASVWVTDEETEKIWSLIAMVVNVLEWRCKELKRDVMLFGDET